MGDEGEEKQSKSVAELWAEFRASIDPEIQQQVELKNYHSHLEEKTPKLGRKKHKYSGPEESEISL